jgi:allantoicase
VITVVPSVQHFLADAKLTILGLHFLCACRADAGFLDYAEIDTNYFIGNFPQLVDLYATVSDQVSPQFLFLFFSFCSSLHGVYSASRALRVPAPIIIILSKMVPDLNSEWTEILAKSKLGPHQQQYFQITKPQEKFTHVRMTIYPGKSTFRVGPYHERGIDIC